MIHSTPIAPERSIVLAAIGDPARLATLRATQLLDTPPEEPFDRLTRLAKNVIGAPASFLTLVDESRDFYKSLCGPGEPLASQRQWEGATFCQCVLTAGGPLVLNDVTALPGWRDLPAVQTLGLRAYAGAPLMTSDGRCLGSFCAVDFAPRTWRDSDVALLTEMAHATVREIELRQALRQASEASQAKGDFLASMSHEIRTPMNAILGLTHLMVRDIQDTGQRDRLSKIDLAARHLLQVMNNVLDVSKLDAGKVQLEDAPLALDALLRDCLALVRPAAQARGLALRLEVGPLPAGARGDATRLRQALLNLLSNAVKFTRQGSVCLRARCLAERRDALELHFEVEDSGEGIEAQALGRLFNRYEQADETVSRRHGGTGLGLALTRQLAQLMGGDVGVHSQLGQGSRFWFTAQLRRDTEPARALIADGMAAAADDEASLRQQHAGQRVLLAEDNPINQEVACELLRYVGLHVDVASDGSQALAMASSGGYDLVLLDVQMPQLDGLTVARRLRAHPGFRSTLVAMTGSALDLDRQACQVAGMDDHLAKPVAPEGLYRMLRRWLPQVPREGGTTPSI